MSDVFSDRHSLPLSTSPLVRREQDLLTARRLLARPHVRLLTLRGPGGIGKTRLALELAHTLAPDFGQRVLWVDLALVRDAALVLPTIARVLQAPSADVSTLASALGPYGSLLVLDNFEHLTPAAPEVAALLACTPNLRVLVTSRTALHLRAEHELPVGPLALTASAQSGEPSAAVHLFLNCAQAVDPHFQLTEGNRSPVERICTLLDGIPLALELAAARLRATTPEGLLGWLERPLDVLTGGPSDGPQHAQSFRSAVAWSYDLLNEPERVVFTICGVFMGSFTLPALEAVTEMSSSREGLIQLVEHSLIQPVRGLEPRWRLLEPVREFAQERLEASQDVEGVRERHARYYLALAERAERDLELLRPDWQARLTADDANLYAAFAWFTATQRAAEALRLVLALVPYWEGASLLVSMRDWATQALHLPGSSGEPKPRAGVLCALGYAEQYLLRLDSTKQSLHEAINLYRGLGDEAGEAEALLLLATVHAGLNEYGDALRLFGQVELLFEAAHNDHLLAVTWHDFGATYLTLGQYRQALSYLTRAQPLAERVGYRNGWAFILMLRAGRVP